MKDSRFGYSTLTREESKRFQTAAYTYGQFQTLFGIDCEANVQPWEYSSESVPNGQITPRAFLDSLSTPQLRQLATFKDFVLPWTDSLCVDSFIYDGSDLSKGKHTNRNRDRMSNLSIPSEHYCHLLLSGGLDMVRCPSRHLRLYIEWIEHCFPNHYASQKLWLTDDLVASISARTDTEHEPDNGKLVLSVGIIDTHCKFNSLHVNCYLTLVSGARCQEESWSDMYNNTSMASLLGTRPAS